MQLSGTFIEQVYYSKKDVMFKTRSGTDPRVFWYQTIRIEDLRDLEDIVTTKNLDEIIRKSSIKIHCTCYAFHYWGFKYKAWVGGYGLEKELHAPRIRNPHMHGVACKHLYQVALVYPFLSKQLAAKMRRFYSKAEIKMQLDSRRVNPNSEREKLKAQIESRLKRQ